MWTRAPDLKAAAKGQVLSPPGLSIADDGPLQMAPS